MALFCKTPFCCLLLLLLLQGCTGTPCATFEFPTLKSSVLTATENSTVKLSFKVTHDNCSLPDSFKIGIHEISTKDRSAFGVYCSIRQENGSCRRPPNENGCECLPEAGLYRMKKRVDRNDQRVWRWTADSDVMMDKELIFNIMYPAKVQSLTIMQEEQYTDELVTEPGAFLHVVCFWENGNPPVTARLLDRHGVDMEGSIYSGLLHYRFPAVGCQDAGLIRCEAPGASHNKTVMLLVRCPPEFETADETVKRATVGNPLQMEFRVRTHTADLADCRLMRTYRRSTAKNTLENIFCNLTGTPPDLTLTVRLDNVTENEFGQWRLELTNDVGNAKLDFYIVEGVDDERPKGKVEPRKIPIESIAILSSLGAVVVVVLIICINVVAGCRKTGDAHDSSVRVELARLEVQQPRNEDQLLPVVPVAGPLNNDERGALPNEYIPVPAAPNVYERPAQPDYAALNPLYEPLRHVYGNLAQRVSRIFVRN